MQGVFVFVLLGLFAVMATLLVLLGAQMYQNTVRRAELNNDRRVLSSYVRSMVRAEDSLNAGCVEKYGDVTALAMHETLEERPYVTWIYAYDGHLRELFTSADRAFEPESGTMICEAQRFEPEISGRLVTMHMTDLKGESFDVQVALRCPAGLTV